KRLASDLRGEGARTIGQRVGAQQRTAPPAGQRASHVSCADQSYLHEGLTLAPIRSSEPGGQIQDRQGRRKRGLLRRRATEDAARRRTWPSGQDCLKKPFSINLARSSAEISTLRGGGMKTLSAIRCMPPSSA